MTQLPLAPVWYETTREMHGSIHHIPGAGYTPFGVVVLSQAPDLQGSHLQESAILHLEVAQFPEPGLPNPPSPAMSPAPQGWLYELIGKASDKPIPRDALLAVIDKSPLNMILISHILCVHYAETLRARISSPDLSAVIKQRGLERGLTFHTAAAYFDLVSWGATSGALLISQVEGVRVTTVRNRLQEARNSGILMAPGAGSRRR